MRYTTLPNLPERVDKLRSGRQGRRLFQYISWFHLAFIFVLFQCEDGQSETKLHGTIQSSVIWSTCGCTVSYWWNVTCEYAKPQPWKRTKTFLVLITGIDFHFRETFVSKMRSFISRKILHYVDAFCLNLDFQYLWLNNNRPIYSHFVKNKQTNKQTKKMISGNKICAGN